MSFEPPDYLRHILAEVEYLIEHSDGLTLEVFESDPTLQRAFVRSLEIIGEAIKKLPPELTAKHPEVEWRSIARMRDRLIHGYFAIDTRLIWEVIRDRVPELRDHVTRILG